MSTNQYMYIVIMFLLLSVYNVLDSIESNRMGGKLDLIVEAQRVHLPTKCKEFYNDGTDRWVECMGVGYK